jgi:cytoskeletal protein RodZ
MKNRDKDKRLMIPKDDFEEEASEGLGRLSREEAEEDLREIHSRIDRRLRKPRIVWIPAAAAVVIILLASVLYILIFREPEPVTPEIAFSPGEIKDTAMIAMAEPLKRAESQSPSHVEALNLNVSPTIKEKAPALEAIATGLADEVNPEVAVKAEEKDEVVVEAIPAAARAVQGVAAAQSDKKSRAIVVATPNLGVATGNHQPEPVGGMEEFNNWVDKNIRYPEEVTPRLRHEVLLTFIVSADSLVTDLKVVETPGDSFTAESFRLLREGPKWVPAVQDGKAIEEEVRIIIVFK